MSEPSPANKCPACGAALPANAPEGLCPKCLLLGVAAPTDPGSGQTPPRPPPPSREAVAAAFPQLEVLGLIGQGGMGCVFKARQPQLNRSVALKILPEALARDPAFAARFTREAQALAALSHPNIVTIHDFGRAGGFFYLLMEFVDGVNLRQALRAGRFTPEQALAIVPPLCDALQFAHERGIVHRDIKPENLLLDRDGRVKVADFGIAKMLAADGAFTPSLSHPMGEGGAAEPGEGSFALALTGNSAAGTPGYMAPEQKSTPQKVDSRADIYSLGVVFYEMLTGELPGEKLQPPSRKVQIDVRLDEIVLRALEHTPELRYQTAAELRTQVETISQAPPVLTSAPHAVADSRQWLRIAAWTAWGLSLPVIGFGVFFLNAMLSETGGWNPNPAEAVVVPLVWVMSVLLPLGGWWLWRAANVPSPRGNKAGLWLARGALAATLVAGLWLLHILQPSERDGNWHPQRMKHFENTNSFQAVLRVAEVAQHGPIVVFTIFHEPGMRPLDMGVTFQGPGLAKLPLLSSATNLTGLVAPTISGYNAWPGTPLSGTNRVRGPGSFRFGFVFPSEALAAMAVEQARHLYLGRPCRMQEWQLLCLFQLKRLASRPDHGKDLWETMQGHLHLGAVPALTGKPAEADMAVQPDRLVFGPMIERVVRHNSPGPQPDSMIDLDSGRLVTPPTPRAADWNWVVANGVDAFGDTAANVRGLLATAGTVVVPVPREAWDKLTLMELRQMLVPLSSTLQGGVAMGGTGELPATFAFKTREGGMGLLQILGLTADQRGVQIRYKLGQTGRQSSSPPSASLGTSSAVPEMPGKRITTTLSVKSGEPFLARLPQGGIELVAVSYHPSTNQPWWRPDGSPTREGLFQVQGVWVNAGDEQAREFLIRLVGMPADASEPVWEFEDGGNQAAGGWPSARGRALNDMRQAAVVLPKTARTATLRIGMGWGDWETLVSERADSTGGVSMRHRAGRSWSVSFSEPAEKDGCVVLAVAHSVKDWEWRVIAIGKDSAEHSSAGRTSGSGDLLHHAAKFNQLLLANVREFRFQVRPYQWVEFLDIALHPRQLPPGDK